MQAPAHARILVVNDDPATLLALTSLLEGWALTLRYTVHAAASGEEALRAVLRHDFAVILLDVNMPGMDGFETAQAIHGHPRARDVPIIFVTAYQADELARLKAYQQGAADFLFTPVIPQILHAKIAVFIALGQKNDELRAQAVKLGERTDKLTAINARLVCEMEERAAAERANDAKDEFLAMLAHELRNPLAAIGSASGLLGMPALAAPAAGRVRDILQRQSRQLSAIVDDLLDLSRARSGKIALACRPVELAALVRTCIETFAAAGRTAAHRLTHDLAPCWVDGDPTRLEQIAANLIDNAVKYTPAGGAIHVTVGLEEGAAVLAVRDDGVGIAQDLLPQVFDLFVQEGRARERAQGGLGIGLALVRKLTALHGGTVEAHSAGQGRGSAFTVRLAAIPAAGDVAAPRPPERLPAGSHILLVDDNDDGRDMLALALEASGYVVRQAADGLRGIELACAEPPRVAIVDIGLPGIDGYEVARRLRRVPALKDMLLVALTGYGLPSDRALALQAGFDLHLVKPVGAEDLVARFAGHGAAAAAPA